MASARVPILFGAWASILAAQSTATVDGLILNRVTGVGIPAASVVLYVGNGNGPAPYRASTDELGRFQFTDVRPGVYRSRIEAEGFAPFTHDELRIDAAQNPFPLRVELPPYTRMRGRVLDPEGRPAPNVEVEISFLIPNASTNDRGEFTFEKVPAGKYTLLARPRPPKRAAETRRADEARTEIVPTFFPSAIDRGQAEQITLRGDSGFFQYDIRLQTAQVFRIRGVALHESGEPAARASLRLHALVPQANLARFVTGSGRVRLAQINTGETGLGPPEATVEAGDNGAFEFPSVRPGDWRIEAQTEPVRDNLRHRDIFQRAFASVLVGRRDIDDLEIRFSAPITVQGTLDFGDAAPSPSHRGAVILSPVEGPMSVLAMAQNDGSFRFEDVTPGRYHVRVQPLANFYPAAALLGDRDVTGQTLELVAASPPIRIVYKSNGSTIRGRVENATECSVVLVPQAPRPGDWSQTIDCASGGTFEFTGVPPGAYSIAAFPRFDPSISSIEMNPSFPGAVRVNAAAESSVSLELKLSRLPE